MKIKELHRKIVDIVQDYSEVMGIKDESVQESIAGWWMEIFCAMCESRADIVKDAVDEIDESDIVSWFWNKKFKDSEDK